MINNMFELSKILAVAGTIYIKLKKTSLIYSYINLSQKIKQDKGPSLSISKLTLIFIIRLNK